MSPGSAFPSNSLALSNAAKGVPQLTITGATVMAIVNNMRVSLGQTWLVHNATIPAVAGRTHAPGNRLNRDRSVEPPPSLTVKPVPIIGAERLRP